MRYFRVVVNNQDGSRDEFKGGTISLTENGEHLLVGESGAPINLNMITGINILLMEDKVVSESFNGIWGKR